MGDFACGIDKAVDNSIPVTIESGSYQNQLNVNVQSWAPAYSFSGDTDTGMWQSSSNTISINATIGGIPFTRETMREHMENAYIVGKMDKAKLIEHLEAFYNGNGLDMAETLEEIEIAKEKFIKTVKESV